MESNMTLMKKLERELILDWQRLQREIVPELKAAALKAYYIKLANYRKERIWNLELLSPI
jgi:hypothetical protein